MTIRLDFGCGPNKKQVIPGEPDQTPWIGVDKYAFDGKVDVVLDVCAFAEPEVYTGTPTTWVGKSIPRKPWPWPDSSVDEAYSSHFVEHLTQTERCHFFNELHRILKPDAKALIIVPHWSSGRAYGDPTHQWPAWSDMAAYYLKREWRESQAPHTDAKNWPPGYSCDFEATWGYSFRNDAEFMSRNDHYKQYAMANYRDVIQDCVMTVIAKKPAPAAEPPA